MWHFIREIQERLSIESHNYVRFGLSCGENIHGDAGDISGVLIYAYRRRYRRRRRRRRRRRAPPRAVAPISSLFPHNLSPVSQIVGSYVGATRRATLILRFRGKQSCGIHSAVAGHSCDFCDLRGFESDALFHTSAFPSRQIQFVLRLRQRVQIQIIYTLDKLKKKKTRISPHIKRSW